jgi:hypothetical protein
MLGTIAKYLVTLATWRPRFVHPLYNLSAFDRDCFIVMNHPVSVLMCFGGIHIV